MADAAAGVMAEDIGVNLVEERQRMIDEELAAMAEGREEALRPAGQSAELGDEARHRLRQKVADEWAAEDSEEDEDE